MGYKHIKIPKEGSKIKLSDGVIQVPDNPIIPYIAVSYTHLRAHETVLELVCRLLLE